MLSRIGWRARYVSILHKIIYGNSFVALEVLRALKKFCWTIACKLKITKLPIEFWTSMMTIDYLILIKSWFYDIFTKELIEKEDGNKSWPG